MRRPPDYLPDRLEPAGWLLLGLVAVGVIGFLAVGTLVVWSLSS